MLATLKTNNSEDIAKEILSKLSDPWWRITSGKLYKIIIKGDEGEDDLVKAFIPNRAQRKFLKKFWHRNIILKARQLGFTTLIAIMFLDHALFNANVRCGIVAQNKDAAESIFRDKVKFAYENLPDLLKQAMPLKRDSADELLFAHNNSSMRVATSMRSGTIHRLHISEFGKICAEYPKKAKEVVTGSIPAVPKNGVLIIESTSEGKGGQFHDMTLQAIKVKDAGKPLSLRDYMFHFYPWHDEKNYVLDPENVVITKEDHKYFDELEANLKKKIELNQRAWYIATRNADYAGEEQLMWQEYPSTPAEAFQKSTKGCYYTNQMTAARREGRICRLQVRVDIPCNTFWDIGSSDGCAVWVHQQIGQNHNFIRFKEGWGESYAFFAKWIQSLGFVWGTHYLPHDAHHERQGKNSNESPKQMLEELMPGHRFEIVPVIPDVTWGIQQTRDVFSQIWIDEEHCKEGIDHLDQYKKGWNKQQQCWTDHPAYPQVHREAADALRQFGQSVANGALGSNTGATSSDALRKARARRG